MSNCTVSYRSLDQLMWKSTRDGVKLTRFFIFLVLFVLLSACSLQQNCDDPMGCIKIQKGSELQIGVEVATIGELLDPSMDLRSELEEMVSAENSSKNSIPLKLHFFETTCNAEKRVIDAARIITQNLAGFIGPVCESGSGKFEKMISDAGILSITPFQSSGKIKVPGYFSIFPSLEVQATAFANNVKNYQPELGFLVIHQESVRVMELAKLICEKLMNCRTILWEEWLSKQDNFETSSTLQLFLVNQAEFDNSSIKIPQGGADMFVLFDPGLRTINPSTVAENRIQRILPILPATTGPSGSRFYSTLAARFSLGCLLTTLQKAIEKYPDGSSSIPRQAIRLAFAKNACQFQSIFIQPCPSGEVCPITDQLFKLVPDGMQ